MESLEKEFKEKFGLDYLTIQEVGGWIISLRPQQPTIGSMVLTLNRYCQHLAEINEKESADLIHAFQQIEIIVKHVLKADKINYLVLMMVDEQVHFHVIPRYKEGKTFNGNIYIDSDWPGPPSLKALSLNDLDINLILQLLKGSSSLQIDNK